MIFHVTHVTYLDFHAGYVHMRWFINQVRKVHEDVRGEETEISALTDRGRKNKETMDSFLSRLHQDSGTPFGKLIVGILNGAEALALNLVALIGVLVYVLGGDNHLPQLHKGYMKWNRVRMFPRGYCKLFNCRSYRSTFLVLRISVDVLHSFCLIRGTLSVSTI